MIVNSSGQAEAVCWASWVKGLKVMNDKSTARRSDWKWKVIEYIFAQWSTDQYHMSGCIKGSGMSEYK